MKTNFKGLLLTFAILGLPFAASAQTEKGVAFNDNTPMKDIYAKAKAENKMILVDCYTSWCGPCKMMAKQEFPKKEMGDFFNPKYVAVKIDMEKGEGAELLKLWDVNAFPTFLILDTEGKVLLRLVGYRPAEKFIKEVQEGLDKGPYDGLDKQYAAGERSPEFIQKYLKKLQSLYATDTYRQVANDFLKDKVNQILTDKTYCDLFLEYTEMNPYNDLFLKVYNRRGEFKVTDDAKAFDKAMTETWYSYPNTNRDFFDIKGTGHDMRFTMKADKLNEYYAYMQKQGIKNFKDIKAKIQMKNCYCMPYLSKEELFGITKSYFKKGNINDEIFYTACSDLYRSKISDSNKKTIKGWIEKRIKDLASENASGNNYFTKRYNEILSPVIKK
jgi:thioredoxin-related protein